MTIKQLGGVFGRNPTFNDVTIEGTLTFDGAIDITSDLTIEDNLYVLGSVGIGTSSLLAAGSSYTVVDIGSASTRSLLNMTDNGTETGRIVAESNQLHFSSGTASGFIGFRTGGFSAADEAMRINSDGALLVGTTTTFPGSVTNVAGMHLGGTTTGRGYFSNDGGRALNLNRMTSDGDIIEFRKDSSTVGSIGCFSGETYFSGTTSGVKAYSAGFVPTTGDGTSSDNTKDWGAASARWQDIYATNGTIQTSDRNEKQDIEELSDAEQRVAVACKGLLRKFRWKSAVEEKGDDARIHFGIIAQDLQAAFEAEGLDAGRYAMFINSTWTDEETGEERSRMGVRYSELLAFIIAAI